jgi:phosphatidylserine decarboxylase
MRVVAVSVLVLVALALFWRYVWFFRNPERTTPLGHNIVSPADGTVVYVKEVKPGEAVISIKQGLAATIEDILRSDVDAPKLLIGIFMSPFDVHYNRSPLDGVVESIRRYPPKTRNFDMRHMHFRSVFNLQPLYADSVHIIENERAVTRIRGTFRSKEVTCYVVQIGARTVHGIDAYIPEGARVAKGQVFGMIRIGSQVDLVVPLLPHMEVKAKVGGKVRAGETVLVE